MKIQWYIDRSTSMSDSAFQDMQVEVKNLIFLYEERKKTRKARILTLVSVILILSYFLVGIIIHI